MKVPFQLRRLASAEPAVALLVPLFEPSAVLRLCARLGFDPLPEIFATAEGMLLKLPVPLAASAGGVVRLRGLAPNLFLPVDADLVPGLLAEEAAALVRDRGLVFLPGPRVLEYEPSSPIPLAALVKVDRVRRSSWQPLPPGPELAEDVTRIAQEMPPQDPEEMLAAGGSGIGEEAPRPDDAKLPKKMLGQSLMGLGKGMAWVGKTLGLGGLAGLGAKLMAGAMRLAPRLSEKLMGQQEASLRDLLKDFQDGNIEKALKRALPLGLDNVRGGVPAANAQLPLHNLFYSLQNLLGGRGGVSFWFSQDDTYRALEREYRKQAERATQAGDYRRAAFIYAKLLNDFRSAAAALAGGGLHRDAALLYLQKLQDPHAAAREYEAAGDIDLAVDLYLKNSDHALAGDVLRRAGEEERAIAQYLLAAARLVTAGKGHYQAGELLRSRAQRPDLALEHYEAGWQQRPADSPVDCAVRIVQRHADHGEPGKFLGLVGEAEEFFDQPGHVEPAGHFFNEIAQLAEKPGLAKIKEDIHDRALQGIAGKLRQGMQTEGRLANLVPLLLPATSVWAAPVVRDALVAASAPSPLQITGPPGNLVLLHEGIVQAVAHAPASGDVFVGFAGGELVHFRPATGAVVLLYKDHGPITSLAVSPAGDTVVALSQRGQGRACLSIFSQTVGYRMQHYHLVNTEGHAWLCPEIPDCTNRKVILWSGHRFQFHRIPDLLPTFTVGKNEVPPAHAGIFWAPSSSDHPGLAAFVDRGLCYFPSPDDLMTHPLGWTPAIPQDEAAEGVEPFDPDKTMDVDLSQQGSLPLGSPLLAWRVKEPAVLEIAGLNAQGSIHVSTLDVSGPDLTASTHSWQQPDRYRAVAWIRPGLLAGVTENGVDWIRVPKGKLQGRSWVSLPRALACFFHQQGRELLVICGHGLLARVPVSN